jgi:superfamily II DNA or RNA helicase
MSGIRDNHARGTAASFLTERIAPGSVLSFASAYFTMYAYDALSTQLEQAESLRFLFGEPSFIETVDPSARPSRAFALSDDAIVLPKQLEQREIAQRCARWIEDKVEIKSIREANLLHGKLFYIDDGRRDHALLGSSNLTLRGLGLHPRPNLELNLVVDGDRDRADLKVWFDEIWANDTLVKDVKQDVLNSLRGLFANYSPEFVYLKTLHHLFGGELARQSDQPFEQLGILETQVWQALFDFQKDGAKAAIQKLNDLNGCVLADSVGLGKTYTALAVIKYFELRGLRVLVLCPKKLRENWTTFVATNASELNPFIADKFGYTVLSQTDLSRDSGRTGDVDLSSINWGAYDLVVIDESHNFRNNTRGQRDESGATIRKSRYERLMEDVIQAGVKTKVLLLSATPVNNDLKDLRNQIYFITGGSDHALATNLGITSIKETLASAQRVFVEWAKRAGEHDVKRLLDGLPTAFFTLLDQLTIARSRKHIQRHYQSSLAKIGRFPTRLKPRAIYSEIDTRGRFMSYDRLHDEIDAYSLAVFNPTRFVKEEFRAQYEAGAVRNFSQGQRENFLIGMMKVNFLKRLESSVFAFGITMGRTVAKIETMETRLLQFLAAEASTAETLQQELFSDEDDEDVAEAFSAGGAMKFDLRDMNVREWLEHLARDKQQLSILENAAKAVGVAHDAKLAQLKTIISEKITSPTTNDRGEANRKVLVFTAFADTANYLYEALVTWAKSEHGVNIALVSGGSRPNATTFGKAEFGQILANFSPRAKQRAKMRGMPQEGEIDILIATDCISEGQNLQDCDLLVNYDIHWNPVRIIQRFGRIDRIGSTNSSIQLVNFWPTPDLNKYINLKSRVESRMALVDVAATAEDNLLLGDDLKELIEDDLRYRDKQLIRLRDEVLDLEDFSDTVSLTEFTLADFRTELDHFDQAVRQTLEAAPEGIHALTPPHPAISGLKTGVIFCLRQKTDGATLSRVNPLSPYYLAYVQDDGSTRFGLGQPKQVLELFRSLCVGQTEPYDGLCTLFDAETSRGADMSAYSGLLQNAVDTLVGQVDRKSLSGLFASRGGKLVDEAAKAGGLADFDLVTWLIIKDGEAFRAT